MWREVFGGGVYTRLCTTPLAGEGKGDSLDGIFGGKGGGGGMNHVMIRGERAAQGYLQSHHFNTGGILFLFSVLSRLASQDIIDTYQIFHFLIFFPDHRPIEISWKCCILLAWA